MVDFDNPSRKHPHRPWWIAAAGLALLALAYSGFWFYLASTARDGVVQWVEKQRARGLAVRYDSLVTVGYPLSIRLNFSNPGIGAPNAAAPWGWEGGRLSIMFRPWDMQNLQAAASGKQMLAFPLDGRTQTYTGEAGFAEGALRLSGGDVQGLRLNLNGVAFKPEKPGLEVIGITAAALDINRLALDGADHQTATASVTVTARGVTGPWLKISPLGEEVQNLTIEGHLMGSIERGPLTESLENWRDGGGTFELSKLNVHHGPLKINTDGTIALDEKLQPIGALTAHVEGFFETVDALQRLKMVKPRDAVTATMVLGVLSRKSLNGGPATLNLALTIQNRRLYAGPVGLLDVPRIEWRALAN